MHLFKTSIETYITNLIPQFSKSFLLNKVQLNIEKIKKHMIENKEKKFSIGTLFLDQFCNTMIFTDYV